MAKGIKRKESFGGCDIDHSSPPLSEDVPKGINLAISFEDGSNVHPPTSLVLRESMTKRTRRITKSGRRQAKRPMMV